MMKKWLAVLLALMLCLGVCACAPADGEEESSSVTENSSVVSGGEEEESETGSSVHNEVSSLPEQEENSETGKPSEGTSKPSEGTSKPSEGTSKPSEGTSKPSEGTSKPSGSSPETPDSSESKVVVDSFDDGISYPHVIGSFMQPGAFESYSKSRMVQHLQHMKDVGIEILILQWSFTTDASGKVTETFYDHSFAANEKTKGCLEYNDLVKTILSAAEEVGVKVFLGLNENGDWWSKGLNDKNYLTAQTNVGVKGAKQLYDTYKAKYPNAFYGWYFVFEYYNFNATQKQIDNGAYFLKSFRDGLYAIDPTMPMMLSPFVSSGNSSAATAEKMWKGMLANNTLKAGDIFCCQDAVGAGHININQLDSYFKALKAAVDTAPGVRFWANTEDFTLSEGATAPLDRFVEEMKIADKYVEHHVTFAYSHYQNPDVGKVGYHEAYKEYYKTGKIPASGLVAPSVNVVINSGGMFTEISGSIQNPDKMIQKLVITKNGSVIQTVHLDSKDNYGKSSYSFATLDANLNVSAGTEVTYGVYAVDYYGHSGPVGTKKVTITAGGGYNAAAGKSYTTVGVQDGYPDESGKGLTDGLYGEPTFADKAWLGYLGKPEIVIDLGTKTDNISAFMLSVLGGGDAGILAPATVTVLVSDDGVNFTEVASASYTKEEDTKSAILFQRYVFASKPVSARYVKITFTTAGSWMFVDEAQVIASK
ncbi:MAG: DUF4434 domain-containing protein [Oscillospiraceae bacterium]|nr:DUF4434 domain-containing protein [Oscillospiraceae bacterium]